MSEKVPLTRLLRMFRAAGGVDDWVTARELAQVSGESVHRIAGAITHWAMHNEERLIAATLLPGNLTTLYRLTDRGKVAMEDLAGEDR